MPLIREINAALLLAILLLAMMGCSEGTTEPLAQPTVHGVTGYYH
jgi:hypothetical protein